MKNHPPTPARQLVGEFSTISSTEELVLFIAGTNNMLQYCNELMEQYDRDDLTFLTMEINTLCAELGVLPGLLYGEIRKVLLALNTFHKTDQNHYAVLGLTAESSTDEIKKAYRRLSKQYHPDIAGGGEDATRRFMEITGAYHAIMAARHSSAPELTPWRRKNPQVRGPNRRMARKNFFIMVASLILLLGALSIFLSGRYNKKVNDSQVLAWAERTANRKTEIVETPRKPELPDPVRPAREKPIPEEAELPQPAAIKQNGDKITRKQTSSPGQPVQQGGTKTAQELKTHQSLLSDTEALTNKTGKAAEMRPIAAGRRQLQPEKAQTLNSVPVAGENKLIIELMPANVSAPEPVPGERETAAQPLPQEDGADITEQAHTVLTRFATLYTRQELDSFLTLFTENATENGRSLMLLVEQYRSLFSHTDTIDLQFQHIQYTVEEDGVHAAGGFHAIYAYREGITREYNGEIKFLLTDARGKLKIQSLEYVFLE